MRKYGTDLDINRQKRTSFGLKSNRIHRKVPVDASKAKPGSMLEITLEKINFESIVPNTIGISFRGKPKSITDKAACFVQNLVGAITKSKNLKFTGASATLINEYDEYKLFGDLWLTKGERKGMILQGIQENLGLKYRLGAKKDAGGAALTGVTDKQKAIATAYGDRFFIPLDDALFNDVSPFSPCYINNNITIELQLAEAKEVVISSDVNASYEIYDIDLEWDAIQDITLSREIGDMYQTGFGVHYDRIQFFEKKPYDKSSTYINVKIRESLRSLRGVLILFKDLKDQTSYAYNRESFYNPKIKKVLLSINGASNKFYANGIYSKDLWPEIRKFFQGATSMTQEEFYNDKFGLWLDTRSSTDMTLHGNGMELDGGKSGLNLAIDKTADGDGEFTMYIYLIIDAVMEFHEGSYKKTCYSLGSCSTGDGDE